MLVYGHEGTCELTVLEETIDLSVEPKEEQVAVFLRDGQVQLPQRHMELLRIQIAPPILIQDPKRINQIEILSQ